MGGVAPSDSVATGNLVLVAGSESKSGRVRILTRGLDQSAEYFLMPDGDRTLVYSRGQAAERNGDSIQELWLELAVASQSPNLPLVLIAAVLNDPDSAFRYMGQETLDGFPVYHIRCWNTFSSKPNFEHLAEFSVRDLWIDAASGLPRKLSYERRAAGGSEPGIPVEVHYADYRNVGGVLYPFLVRRSLNGTPWATITIDTVSLNVGLTDYDFSVE